MEVIHKITIDEIIRKDFRTVVIFLKYGIDFYCKGYRTLDEVCKMRDIDKNLLFSQLGTVNNTSSELAIESKCCLTDYHIDFIKKANLKEDVTQAVIQYLNKLNRSNQDFPV